MFRRPPNSTLSLTLVPSPPLFRAGDGHRPLPFVSVCFCPSLSMSTQRRRTKILATLGPATDKPGGIEALIAAGVDVVRMNFSHGKPEDHARRAAEVRDRKGTRLNSSP